MKKHVEKPDYNYLEYIPVRSGLLTWQTDQKGIVTLEIQNKGFFNRAAQKFFHRPKITYIHLDELGSFVWPLLDGEKNMIELGREVEARFGDKAAPLYERLAKYFQILESYHFVTLKKKEQ